MKIYTITREGKYRHEILGAYVSVYAAMEVACKETQKEDEDGYHEYQVSELEIGIPCENAVPLYSYRKKTDYDRSTRPHTVIRVYPEIQRFQSDKWEVINEDA